MNLENCTKILDRIIHIAKSQGTPEVHCGCRFPIILAMCGVEFKGEVKAPYYYYNTVDDIRNFFTRFNTSCIDPLLDGCQGSKKDVIFDVWIIL